MARSVTPDLYPDLRPLGLLLALLPVLRSLSLLAALTLALFLVAVAGAFLPLGTWLVLSLGLAVPTLASLLLVALD